MNDYGAVSRKVAMRINLRLLNVVKCRPWATRDSEDELDVKTWHGKHRRPRVLKRNIARQRRRMKHDNQRVRRWEFDLERYATSLLEVEAEGKSRRRRSRVREVRRGP
jgi:hypothetical protein